jgi:SynChlorMet cassette radical SAM/SPASM protein ScmE
MTIPSLPLDVFIGLTNRCNLHCQHCNVSTTRDVDDEMSTVEIKNLIAALSQQKIFKLVLTGGEPFVREDIFEILNFIEQQPLRFSINTNATLINESSARRLTTNRRLDGILVSLDGANASVHDRLRGDGAFERALRGLEILTRFAKEKITIFTVVTKYNFHDLANIAALVDSLNISSLRLEPLMRSGSGLLNKEALTLNETETIFVYDTVKRLRDKYGCFIDGNYLSMGEKFRAWPNETAAEGDKGGEMYNCPGAVTKVVIRPDGWVTPCDRLWDLKLGNLRTQSLEDIWVRAEPTRNFRERCTRTVDEREECKDCPYRTNCHGGCPAVGYYAGEGIMGLDSSSCYKHYQEARETYEKVCLNHHIFQCDPAL